GGAGASGGSGATAGAGAGGSGATGASGGSGGEKAEETPSSSVSYYEGLIEFQFAEEYVVGRFVHGDYWGHNRGGDVVIIAITATELGSPAGSERVMNGTLLHPNHSGNQGYDSSARDMGFEAALNVDPAFTGQVLVVSPAPSVIKGISAPGSEGRPVLS